VLWNIQTFITKPIR